MNYIVMDLEWNQSSTGQEAEAQRLPFEIIEIGAIQLNDGYAMINQFNELIKPQVYHELNEVTGQLMHMEMEELNRGKPFFQVVEAFLKWCGEQPYLFCTWGVQDLTELQRNMKFYNMAPLSDGPIAFLDVQKLFDRYYTVETAQNSTGLGLSIARRLTGQMGGRIGAAYHNGCLTVTVDFSAARLPEDAPKTNL